MVDKLSVLRECYRTLKPGGRMAGYTIHTPGAITEEEAARATELGPSQVTGPEAPDALARQCGFQIINYQNVTAAFRKTCTALLNARNELEDELRREEGDDYFERERTKKETMLIGIQEGLLLRALIVAVKPA